VRHLQGFVTTCIGVRGSRSLARERLCGSEARA
jgi:hypothetical protein